MITNAWPHCSKVIKDGFYEKILCSKLKENLLVVNHAQKMMMIMMI